MSRTTETVKIVIVDSSLGYFAGSVVIRKTASTFAIFDTHWWVSMVNDKARVCCILMKLGSKHDKDRVTAIDGDDKDQEWRHIHHLRCSV